jgi:hypothetical protein
MSPMQWADRGFVPRYPEADSPRHLMPLWSYTPTSRNVFIMWSLIIKHLDNFVFTFHIVTVVQLIKRDMGVLDWTLELFDIILSYTSQWRSRQFSITVYIALSLFKHYSLFTITRTWSSQSAVPCQSSGIGFKRRTFSFPGSRTVFVPQPHS